jgi:2-polyprenyl-3-methyl-5-hydroxy-6-metoxy-1,4-benzoquinol methylase
MKLYKQNEGFNAILNTYRAKQVLKFAKGKTCLEIGFGEEQITKHLVKKFDSVTAIDCCQEHFDNIKKYNNLVAINSKFEFYYKRTNGQTFDYIVCTNILEHVDDVGEVLNIIKSLCHKKTLVFISVPNARSYNRMLGVELGMLKHHQNLDKGDKYVGHKRMYTPLELELRLLIHRFKILKIGTVIYKPFPNSIMEKLPKSIINRCLDYNMKDNGAEIYALCKLP